ncbi:hypothetical protein B0H14DRAFT_2564911 [Mycena olivaceomarginata]|nr:hypothetical protein B0H14DRAFT_2564911 [Mycena olivaceomarginata]
MDAAPWVGEGDNMRRRTETYRQAQTLVDKFRQHDPCKLDVGALHRPTIFCEKVFATARSAYGGHVVKLKVCNDGCVDEGEAAGAPRAVEADAFTRLFCMESFHNHSPIVHFRVPAPAPLDHQPSLGLLDGALSFIAAERALWTAQHEADVWEHVVEARCKHRLKRTVRNPKPDDASQDDHIEEEDSLAAEDADDPLSSFDNTTLTTTTTHTIPATPTHIVPSTLFRSRKEWGPQQALTNTSPPVNHVFIHSKSTPQLRMLPFAQANPHDRPPGASATLIHVNILIRLLVYLQRYSVPPPPAHSSSASVSVTHTATPVIPKGLTMDALPRIASSSDMAWTKIRPRFISYWNSDLGSRINAMLLAYSFTPKAHEKILTTLGINLKDYRIAFDSMAHAVDRNFQLARFDSEKFWTSAKLENCGFNVPGQLDTLIPDFLGALQQYSQDVHDLIGLVRQSVRNSPANHTTSARVHQHMDCDLAVVVARLVLFLRDDESYKEFLRYCGTDAQLLLDFFQDLSRSSGLHPRCLTLSGLQKVGQQLAGGVFGDIWKGLVHGQSVCVHHIRPD